LFPFSLSIFPFRFPKCVYILSSLPWFVAVVFRLEDKPMNFFADIRLVTKVPEE